MVIACICVASFLASPAILRPPPAAMPGKQGAGEAPVAQSPDPRELLEVGAAGFLGLPDGSAAVAADPVRQPSPIEFGARVMSVAILGQEQRPSFRFEPSGSDIRCIDTRAKGTLVVGKLEWSGSQVLWTWSEDQRVLDPESAAALESAICGLGLLATMSDGRERRIAFVMPEAPARSQPAQAAESESVASEPAAAVIPRAPFQPKPDPLGDVAVSSDLLFRGTAQLKSVRVTVPEPESGLAFAQESPTVIVARCKDASGAPVELGRFEASGMEVRWKWRRVDVEKCGSCLGELQDLAEAMTLEVEGVNGTRSFACLEPLEERLEGVVTDLPSGAASGRLSSDDRLVLRAIRFAEEKFSDEAAAWTRAQARAIQQQRDAARRASEANRKARNAQQRHEEKNGWWDRDGHWHAPDGHRSRSQDDREDGLRKARPGGGVGGGIQLRGAWGAKMASEVDAERSRDATAGQDPDRLLGEAADIDSPQLRKFVDKWIGNITDSRIRDMLKLVRQELARLRAAAGAAP